MTTEFVDVATMAPANLDRSMETPSQSSPSKPLSGGAARLLAAVLQALVMVTALALFFLFAGVAAFVLLHLLVAGRALHRRPHPSPPSPSPGLSTKDLKLLPCSKYSRASMGASDCPICLEAFRDWDRVRVIPGCGHEFHAPCVDKWLVKTPACPICRRPVRSSGGVHP
ncbi:RING-H2 finger protein ATL56-like [Dioscorea cayenensis subsp. rotundata]|uniref:RING-H2 finger protein ATL56-like n=1 Tax=Dioscorea cayennensis subsp. rotundata TaxID=55577 RepID=A0AB40BX57_DIOCR|nr:RING-H2 finger protein ATL56-like [Dioscorea cayenensis subsp. rotundata]